MAVAETNTAGQRAFAERLVAIVLDHPTSRISGAAIAATVLCMQDTIGVALASAAMRVAGADAAVALAGRAGESAVIWGAGRSAASHDAALANGMRAHGLDFDDTHPAAIMHASAVNVGVALALGEALRKNPQDIIAAEALGYEVSARLGHLAPGRTPIACTRRLLHSITLTMRNRFGRRCARRQFNIEGRDGRRTTTKGISPWQRK